MKQFSRTTGLYERSLIAAHNRIGLVLTAAGGFKSAKKQQQSGKWNYRILHGGSSKNFLEVIENEAKEAV